ncbi:hypothetical protein RQP46_008330 [Phenoliferia psychrophenolica]
MVPSELILLVFLHGFKGGADTQTHPTVAFTPVVYPSYDTRGELSVAVETHVKWLTDLTAEHRVAHTANGATGPVRVILIGHSMGGLVIADSLRSILASPTPTSPNILGLIAFDTPYYGLNPGVFKNSLEKGLGYAQNGHAVLTALGVGAGIWGTAFGGAAAAKKEEPVPPAASPSAGYADSKRKDGASTSTVAQATPAAAAGGTSWYKIAGAAAALAVVGAGATYYGKDAATALTGHWDWAKSHLSFVGELWAKNALEARMEAVEKATQGDIGFHCFYTLLPKTASHPSTSRTFIILPHGGRFATLFSPNANGRAADEVVAHTEMFTSASDGMFALGADTCALISEWVDRMKGAREKQPEETKEQKKGPEVAADDNPWA